MVDNLVRVGAPDSVASEITAGNWPSGRAPHYRLFSVLCAKVIRLLINGHGPLLDAQGTVHGRLNGMLIVPARTARICDEGPEVAVVAGTHVHLTMVLSTWVPVGSTPVARLLVFFPHDAIFGDSEAMLSWCVGHLVHKTTDVDIISRAILIGVEDAPGISGRVYKVAIHPADGSPGFPLHGPRRFVFIALLRYGACVVRIFALALVEHAHEVFLGIITLGCGQGCHQGRG